jgi:hypothetical protein
MVIRQPFFFSDSSQEAAMTPRAIFAVAMCMSFAGDAFAWNLRGHMEIAAIAWHQLKPATKPGPSAPEAKS